MADHKIEKHLLGWICVAITLAGICLIIVSSKTQIPEIRDIGSTLCSIGLIGFIFQYYFHSSLERSLEKRMEKLAKCLEERIKPQVAIDSENLGVKRILLGRYEFDEIRLKLYDGATNISWLSRGPALPSQFDMVEQILKLLGKGKNFRFLAFANQPGIEKTIQRLTEVKKKNKGPGKLEIKLYDNEPTWYIQMIDNVIYTQPYLRGIGIGHIPVFVVEKGKTFFESLERHFSAVWKDAISIEQYIKEKTQSKE